MKPELVILTEEGETAAGETVALGGGGDPLREVAHALSSRSLGPDSCVRLLWPRHRCPLLRDDVVLVDTPGRQRSRSTFNMSRGDCKRIDLNNLAHPCNKLSGYYK